MSATARTAWSVADMPDLHGRRAVVTGVTGGLGLETARELARAGARVVLTGRDEQKLERAAAEISGELPQAELETVRLDLAELASVRRAAEEVLAGGGTVDVLVNNAGVMATPHRRTADGFELQVGTNHLGHFAFTGLLLPALAHARVVTVTSLMHRVARRVTLDDPRTPRRYNRWLAYGESKLANLQFALELDRRARGAGLDLTSVAAHPGYAATELQVSGPRLAGRWSPWAAVMAVANPVLGQPAAAGALPSLYAATTPDLPGGALVGPSGPGELRGAPRVVGMSRSAQDAPAASALWQWSEEATGVTFWSAVT